MAGGSVELSVSLSLAELLRDAKKASEVLQKQLKDPRVNVDLDIDSGKISKLNGVLQGIAQGVGQKAFGLLADQVGNVAGFVASTTLEMEKFRTVLTTTLGSAGLADEALSGLKDFAANTPSQLNEVVDAYIKLKNRGIDPTNEALTNLGDIAASQGKSLNQITEAVLDAQSGEFERLKEFGITAKTTGDTVALSFKGITTEVAKTPEALSAAVLGFGELEGVAGGMAAQAATLGGQLSTLQDVAGQAANAFGQELVPVFLEFVSGLNEGGSSLEELARSLGSGTAEALKLLVSALKFAADNGETFSKVLQILLFRVTALKAIALAQTFQAAAVQLGVMSVAGGVTSISLTGVATASKAAIVALAPLAIQLAAIAVAVEGIKFAKFANDLRNSNTDTDAAAASIGILSDEAFAAASKTKAAADKLNASKKAGQELTAQEITDSKNLVTVNNERIKALKDELKETQALGTANEEQEASKANLLQTLQTSIGALEKQNTRLSESVGISGKAVEATKKEVDAVKEAADAYAQRSSELANDNKLREAEIKTAIANGAVAEAEGQKQLLDQDRSFGQQRLALAETQAVQLRDLLGSTKDPEKLKELNGKILEADGAIADARLAIAETYAKEREAAEKAALERIEAANRESEARITASQQARIGAVKQAQLDGTKTAEEAAQAIAQIEQDGIAETVAARRSELAQVQSLRAQGLLSAEEARDRELGLNEEIGSLNLERIDKEIAAQEAASAAALKAVEAQKQAVLDAIDAAGDAAKNNLQSQDIELGLTAGANSQESTLLSAQLELQQAIAQVEQSRFDSAIQKAKLSGNDIKAEQLKLAQLKAQQKATEKQFEIEKLQLRLAQEQRKIELERQRIAADIAVIEADIALKKAIANGASKEEIDNLQTILGLRQKQVEQVKEGGAQQQKLDEIERATLLAKQENQQRQASDRELAQLGAINNARNPEAGAAEAKEEKEGAKPLGPSAEELEKQRIASGRLNGFNAAGATLSSTAQQLKDKAGNSTIQQLKSPISAIATQKIQPVTDITGLGDALQTGNASVVTEIKELRAAIEALANTPRCLTVSAPDPVGAVGQILADVGKASFRRAKL